MLKRFILISFVAGMGYLGFVIYRLSSEMSLLESPSKEASESAEEADPTHKVYNFSFSKYSTDGSKELEIEGTSANIFEREVGLENVIAKAFSEDTPVTITADHGMLDKSSSMVHLEENVVATTEDGGRLLTHSLDIYPSGKYVETKDQAQVKKDNMAVEGLGARGDSDLSRVIFRKDVTVVIQSEDTDTKIPTVITCEGPLEIDYAASKARFSKDVVATDTRGKLTADTMDVFFDKESKEVQKIFCVGNVVITNPDGSETLSDQVLYLAQEGRMVLGGDMEGVYYPGEGSGTSSEGMFFSK
jgi:LPS export ABC transporter protein LptC